MEKTLNLLNEKLENLKKDYPVIAEFLNNFLWFQYHKFPFYKEIVPMYDTYNEMEEYYGNKLNSDVIDGLKRAIIEMESLASFFYTLFEVDDIEMIAELDTFFGYRPDIQLDIFMTIFDLYKIVQRGHMIARMSKALSELSILSNRIAEMLADKDRRDSITKKDFYLACDIMATIKEHGAPLGQTQEIVSRCMRATRPLTTPPVMQYPIHPKIVIDDFWKVFQNQLPQTALDVFKRVWTNNNLLNIYMLDILKITEKSLIAMEGFKSIEESDGYMTVKMSFRTINALIGQISARVEKRNERVLRQFRNDIRKLPAKTGGAIIKLTTSDNFDRPRFYVDQDIDCVEKVKRSVDRVEKMYINIAPILKNALQQTHDENLMATFEDHFIIVKSRLVTVDRVVKMRTASAHYQNV